MIDWWQGMTIIQQILALFAIPATLVLIFQTVMLLFGLGQGGADAQTPEADSGSWFEDGSSAVSDQVDFSTDTYEGVPDSAVDTSEGPVDYDAGLRLLTVRGMVAFFAVGGWVGIAAVDLGAQPWLASLLAMLSGIAALWLVAVIFKALMSLQSSGNVELGNALGKSGEVYLRIPPAMSGSGKVNVYMQERLVEASAMTRSETELPTGSRVKVIAVQGSRLLVEPEK